jgi:hypothetical protein
MLVAVSAASAFEVGPLKIGGAMRVNYTIGDYQDTGSSGPQRGSHGGNFEMDTFRINLDFKQDQYVGKAEYRFYNGYNFFHTAWVGYDFNNESQIQLGLNRAPFGVGPYGPANSWFFDQHYYVGLSDDMDIGVKYHIPLNKLSVDLAYYLMDEPNGRGNSDDSARYSYDMVDGGSEYAFYKERNQFNIRAIYSFDEIIVPTDLGVSAQWGQLPSQDDDKADDTEAFAYAAHMKSTYGPWTLMAQVTHYKYNADYKDYQDGTNGMVHLNSDLIAMGAYDFAWPVASEGTIPSIALSYTWKPEMIAWIDSIRFYNDWSVIMKNGSLENGKDFNDSTLNVTGMSIARGGWFIYVDYAWSDGNYFVGNDSDEYADTYAASKVGDFGADQNDDWNYRFNINFGYYF